MDTRTLYPVQPSDTSTVIFCWALSLFLSFSLFLLHSGCPLIPLLQCQNAAARDFGAMTGWSQMREPERRSCTMFPAWHSGNALNISEPTRIHPYPCPRGHPTTAGTLCQTPIQNHYSSNTHKRLPTVAISIWVRTSPISLANITCLHDGDFIWICMMEFFWKKHENPPSTASLNITIYGA